MKIIHSIQQLGLTGLISLGLVLVISPISYGQRPTDSPNIRSLISKDHCRESGGDHRYGNGELVSVGKQAFEYLFRMDASRGNTVIMSCRIIRSRGYNPSTLRLKFGIEDGENYYKINTMQVRIYLDGQLKGPWTVVRGKLHTAALDIKNVNSVAIEVEYSEQAYTDHYFYIVDASMLFGTIEENKIYVSSPNNVPKEIIIENNVEESPSRTTQDVIEDTQNVIEEIDDLRQKVEEIWKVF